MVICPDTMPFDLTRCRVIWAGVMWSDIISYVSDKNSTNRNGTGSNGTSGKVGKNGTFSLLGFEVGGLEWGFRFGDGGLSLGFKVWWVVKI